MKTDNRTTHNRTLRMMRTDIRANVVAQAILHTHIRTRELRGATYNVAQTLANARRAVSCRRAYWANQFDGDYGIAYTPALQAMRDRAQSMGLTIIQDE